jgi:DNA-binding NarL/FixJ family response regulator
MSDNDHRTAIAALRAGAVGHIGKDIEPEDPAELVGRAAEGEVIVSQTAADLLARSVTRGSRRRVAATAQPTDQP